MLMFVSSVLYKLVLTVVSYAARIAQIGFLVCVSAFVVITISNGGKAFRTVLALIRFLSCMDTHVYQ
jgi:hypothetical protein